MLSHGIHLAAQWKNNLSARCIGLRVIETILIKRGPSARARARILCRYARIEQLRFFSSHRCGNARRKALTRVRYDPALSVQR